MKLDEIIRAVEELTPEESIVTNWIIVLETTDGVSTELHIASAEGMTPWMAYGMLAAASQMVAMHSDDSDD